MFKPGDRINQYRVDELVARSCLTSIFRATELTTGRKVAIKIPSIEAQSDPVTYQRFHRESQIGRKLHHPSIVKVLDDHDRSRAYIVMEWIDGRTIRTILRENGRLSTERSVRLAINVCEALSYVHTRGIVHHDLKPDNVMVNSADEIKLIDFGIATAGGAHRLVLCQPEEAMGTPDYISPERVRGIRGDARGDIYALGIMLYEMVSGRVPFDGCNALLIMNARLNDDPAPLSTVIPGIPLPLSEIVSRAIQRDPRKRYSDASEFASDLEYTIGLRPQDLLDHAGLAGGSGNRIF